MKKVVIVLFLLVSVFSTTIVFADAQRNQIAFDEFKNLIDTQYIFKDYKNVNWQELYSRHENAILNSRTDVEFANNLNNLVLELKDSHFLVYINANEQYPLAAYLPERPMNYNLPAVISMLDEYKVVNSTISTGRIEDIGYIMINSWGSDFNHYETISDILTEMNNTTNVLILDIRMNGGGSTTNTEHVMKYFQEPILWNIADVDIVDSAINEIVNTQYVIYGAGNLYPKEVNILIGRKSASASESFIVGMTTLDNVITVGDRTWGTAGFVNPSSVYYLLNGVKVQIPYASLKDSNGNYIEDIGVEPDVFVSFLNDGSDSVFKNVLARYGIIPKENEGDSGGGGGCNAGFGGIIILLILTTMPIIRRKR